jgi:RND family efflux transporter MFP subunit
MSIRFTTTLLLLTGCATADALQEPPADEAVAVGVATVEARPVGRPIHASGRLRAASETRLSFPFGGVVADLAVVRGERVRAGQVLAVLDAAPARAQLAAATSAAEKAQRDVTRVDALGNAVSTAQQQDAGTGLAVARANLDAARFQARRSVVVAPSDGVVLDVFVEDDQTVGAGQVVVSFAGSEGYEVELVMSADDALLADPGTTASVTLRGFATPLAGHVAERAGGAGALGGFTVVVALDPVDVTLAPGLVAAVDLQAAPQVYPTVPFLALAEADGSDAAVYVLDGDRVRRTPVSIAFLTNQEVALAVGPPAGSRVVVDGVPFVSDGDLVVVR